MRDPVRCFITTDENDVPSVQLIPYAIVTILQARGILLRGVWMGKS